MRFHHLAVPHSVTHPDYVACAFTQRVVKVAKMLHGLGHEVVHYGCEGSEVDCTEHVSVTTQADLDACYGAGEPWRKGFFQYDLNDACYQKFYAGAITEIAKRKQPRDYLLCNWGWGHKPVADVHSDLIVTEPGAGYSGGFFAPHCVFESYALMHARYGLDGVAHPGRPKWYDAVIPNSFDTGQFDYCATKEDYYLCLGRVTAGKGVRTACDAVAAIGGRLIVAGQGDFCRELGYETVPAHVTVLGYADVEMRRTLLSRARAVFVLSGYCEPYGGVQIEALLSGTPIITSDWGAFAENNLHGLTGYRVRTQEQLLWAMRNIDRINPQVCRDWAAANFSLERVAAMYQEYFASLMKVYDGSAGWYAPNDSRTELDWLTRRYPTQPET